MKDIIGGVSPIKLRAGRAKSRRGGVEAGKATAKKGNWLGGRGGFKKSSGKQGVGVNRPGYNVHTRFKPRKERGKPGGGGTDDGTTTPNKPYKFDPETGDIIVTVNPEFNYNPSNNFSPTNQFNPTNENKNVNKNINTNTNNTEKENKPDEFGYRFETEPGETTTETVTDTGYKSIWESDTSKNYYKEVEGKKIKLTEGERYMKYGHSKRITDEQLDAANFKHGSYHKGGKAFHKSFEGYVEYMQFRAGLSESEKSKTKTSKSTNVRTKTITKGGKTYKIKYNKSTGDEVSRTEVK